MQDFDELKAVGMRIFGGGMLLSDRIADILRNERLKKMEREVGLSDRERKIVERLNHTTK